MKNNLKNGEDSKFLEALFHFIIPVAISLPITNFLNWWYYKFQKSVFSTSDTLLSIHSNVTNSVVFYVPFIIAFLIMLSIRNISSIRIMKIKVFSLIALVIFIISGFILVVQFFEYTDINKQGIYVTDGMFSTNKDYNWNDVTNVEVSYKRGYKSTIDIIYNIYLNDGTVINACNSKDFYNNVLNVDNFVKDKKIKIIRSKIQPSDYNNFKNAFNDDILQSVLEILSK